jgi:Adaptor complexes medium subunit family
MRGIIYISNVSCCHDEYVMKITADFPDDKRAKNVVIKIPMPPTAASAISKASKGRARYEPGERALVWRISHFQGMQVHLIPVWHTDNSIFVFIFNV